MTIYIVRNIAMEVAGYFFSKQDAEKKAAEYSLEHNGEQWFVVEVWVV